MWSYDLDLRNIKLTVVKVVVSSEGTCNSCLAKAEAIDVEAVER